MDFGISGETVQHLNLQFWCPDATVADNTSVQEDIFSNLPQQPNQHQQQSQWCGK